MSAVIELRDVLESDLPTLFEYQREPEANEMAAFPARDREAFTKHMCDKMLSNPDVCIKTIVASNEIVGDIVSWKDDGKRWVGFWIGKAYWGRGITSAALIEFIKKHESSRPLYADVAVHNLASLRVLEKSGFRQTGEVTTGADGINTQLMALVG